MTSDRWQRLERLYHAARERSPSERAGFLAEACGDDTALRRDLESLLSHDGSDDFLETRGLAADSSANTPSAGFPSRAIGVYQLQERIGVGGMGEVYRARDTTLGRDVALKVLPPSVSDDADRRARFEREARLLAALNHPHIAQIYGFEEFDRGRALVMELVEGEGLDELIRARAGKRQSGALPIAKALALARQIADALDAAHDKGIVHRDLKPSNIKVTRAGNVKVLDFGLAKAVDPAVAVAAIATDVSRHPVILGTAPYMSPEQARGEPVDKRADIWAFGCVLFEMLVGHAPFEGDSASDTLYRILSREPDWASLPAETPSSIRTLLERCLRKDPGRRLHDIADARIELDDVERSVVSAEVQPRPATNRRERFVWILSLVLVASFLVAALFYRRGAPASAEPFEFPIDSPPTQASTEKIDLVDFAISPDGRQVVAVAMSANTRSIWLRAVAGPPWRQLIGTEGAISAFWKPDSQSIGFFANRAGAEERALKTVNVAGGPVSIACDLPDNRPPYGTWGRGYILFSSDVVVRKVSEIGGESAPVTKQRDQREVDRSPSFLPDGDHFLYLAQTVTTHGTTNELRVGALSSDQTSSLGPIGSNAVYAAGFLLFVRDDGRLTARPFDPDSRQLTGDPQALVEDVELVRPFRRGQFSVSNTGRLMYKRPGKLLSQLTWFDRKGQTRETVGNPGEYSNMDLNRDSTRLLVTRVTKSAEEPANIDIWRIDLARSGAATRLTFDATAEFDPAWSPDGSQIVFGSFDQDTIIGREVRLIRRSSDGTGENKVLVTAAEPGKPSELGAPEWSPEGRFILFTRNNTEEKRRELWTIELSADGTGKHFLNTPRNAANGAFSPSGRWVAYEADDSRQYEIFVSPFPQAHKRIQISTNGGRAPRWSGNGRELFFLAADGRMMAAQIDPTTGLPHGVPQQLFPTEVLRHGFAMHPYVVTNDGQRFLMPVVLNQSEASAVTVVVDWPARLRK